VPTKKRKAAHAGVVQENVVEIRVRDREAICAAGFGTHRRKLNRADFWSRPRDF
jgi:hypothetical protein